MAIRPDFSSLLLLLLLFPLLLLLSPPSSAQTSTQQITQFIYGLCNTADYSVNTSFATNLNTLIGVLSVHSSSSLYYSYNASNVYGMYQCRGDLSFSSCSSCVRAIFSSGACGQAIGLRIQFQGCYVRYENHSFLDVAQFTQVHTNCSTSNNSRALFQSNLASVLNTTIKSAPLHDGFNASSQGTGGANSAYALAQCLGYLSPAQCTACLSQYAQYKTLCGSADAGRIDYVTCYYRFDDVPIPLFSNTTESLAPIEPPVASPPSLLLTPSPGSGMKTSSGHSKTNWKIPVIVGTVVGVSLAALGALLLAVFCRRKATTKAEKKDQNFQHGAVNFSMEELRKATEDFHSKNKLGEGGFGPVFKGRLEGGKDVAIKMLSSGSHQGKTEFLNEVNVITNVQHRNLIELLGCCVDESNRLLVYEYLPYRSLNLHIFDNAGESVALNWRSRLDIITGIARGLWYLHEDSHVKIVHRDIKASNILLDNNLQPKIADFGLARFFADDVTHITTRVAGTLGYLAPEYAINGQLTDKVDVYSFGLVALEIVSGRTIIDERFAAGRQHLLEWTWSLYERQQQLQILDPKIQRNTEVNAGEVIRVVHVALLCTQTMPQARPTMSQVFGMLCGESESLALPSKPTIISMDPDQHVQVLPFVSSPSSNASQ